MKQRYRWKKYLSILCVMALLMPMLSGLQVHAEELPEETWQETEPAGAVEESISGTETDGNPADMEGTEETVEEITEEATGETAEEITEETTEGVGNPETDGEISSADEEVTLPDTEITEAEEEDTVMGTEDEELQAEDVKKPDEGVLDMGTVSGNEADMPDTSLKEESSADDTLKPVSASEQERTGTELLTYTDEQGNEFAYQADEDGNAVITGITLSGAVLLIPEMIGDMPVAAVSNEGNCVINNPEIRIPELAINCHTIGTKAFSGLTIGTLTIGENVKELFVTNDEKSSSRFYYGQFMNCTIETVVFAATDLSAGFVTGSSYSTVFGPFCKSSIGSLEIADGVTRIPEKMFCDSVMELDTLELRTEYIGAYAFSGADITIHHLIIGEEVKLLEAYSDSTSVDHYWEQFSYSTIGTFTYLADGMELERVAEGKTYTDQYAPFFKSTIGTLEIGENVTRIPELFLYNANLQIEELNLTQEYIGAYAFSGSDIEIGTLTLNSTVKELGTWSYSTDLFQYWEQFSYSTIGTFVYLADGMELERTTGGKSYTEQYAPFFKSNIGNLKIGNSVTKIPELFLNNANIKIGELDLTQSYIGAYAFSGSDIEIGTLTLNTTVKELGTWCYSTDLFQYWEQFSYSTIGTLIYLADGMKLEAAPEGYTLVGR